MHFPQTGDEEQIKTLLAGDEKQFESGLNWLDQEYRENICGLLRRRFPGMPAADLADVWRDAMVSLHQRIRWGTYDPTSSLKGLMWMISVRCGQDRLRLDDARHLAVEAMLEATGDAQSVATWQSFDVTRHEEFLELICDSVSRLPPVQQLVWRVYVEQFPESRSLNLLTESTRRTAADTASEPFLDNGAEGLDEDVVRTALRVARVRIREDLQRKGYDL